MEGENQSKMSQGLEYLTLKYLTPSTRTFLEVYDMFVVPKHAIYGKAESQRELFWENISISLGQNQSYLNTDEQDTSATPINRESLYEKFPVIPYFLTNDDSYKVTKDGAPLTLEEAMNTTFADVEQKDIDTAVQIAKQQIKDFADEGESLGIGIAITKYQSLLLDTNQCIVEPKTGIWAKITKQPPYKELHSDDKEFIFQMTERAKTNSAIRRELKHIKDAYKSNNLFDQAIRDTRELKQKYPSAETTQTIQDIILIGTERLSDTYRAFTKSQTVDSYIGTYKTLADRLDKFTEHATEETKVEIAEARRILKNLHSASLQSHHYHNGGDVTEIISALEAIDNPNRETPTALELQESRLKNLTNHFRQFDPKKGYSKIMVQFFDEDLTNLRDFYLATHESLDEYYEVFPNKEIDILQAQYQNIESYVATLQNLSSSERNEKKQKELQTEAIETTFQALKYFTAKATEEKTKPFFRAANQMLNQFEALTKHYTRESEKDGNALLISMYCRQLHSFEYKKD